jgi:tRNA threonylcarbamoyladenosine biosynthesis protein TsaB
MIVLGLDTSHKTGSLVVARDSQVLFEKNWENEKSHAEFVTDFIEHALDDNKIAIKDVDLFAVNIGPGSFTGIRIAVNAIKSFAYVFARPVYTQNSLELIASSCSVDDQSLIVAINAHSDLCYVQEFSNQNGHWVTNKPIEVKSIDDVIKLLAQPKTMFVGDAFEFYKNRIPTDVKISVPKKYSAIPQAKKLVELANTSKNSTQMKDWQSLEPFYLRLSAPEEKLLNKKT